MPRSHNDAWCSMERGDSSCSSDLRMSVNATCADEPCHSLDHGVVSRCQATGRCRTSATCPITRTSRCRSLGRHHACRARIRPVSTDARSRFPPRGEANSWCCTSGLPTACIWFTSMERSLGTAPTTGWPANTTCHRWSKQASTRSPSSLFATAHRATSKIRTNGGWRAYTARCSSKHAHEHTYDQLPAAPISMQRPVWVPPRSTLKLPSSIYRPVETRYKSGLRSCRVSASAPP